MPSATIGVSPAAEFWALVLAEDDMMRAEFDALIAAAWTGTEADRADAQRHSQDAGRGGGSPADGVAVGLGWPRRAQWQRERSPPARRR